ncbi:MAG TPA: aminotransferase class V-fold PLP-dependent enzyme, partial [Verrucomicrobiota bacterium]|nr:aminotransferase class V-fold PLP-dependent enzyme [Verrucomicrobiota bacterium]
LEFHPGDEILITNHEYNACKNIAEYTAQKTGAKTVVAKIPFPLNSQEEIFHSIMSNVTTKTRAVLIDHITSPTALIFPIEKILCELKKKEIPLVIDGSHAPGMLPLSIKKLDPDFYTANCHKWLCSPKGAGFLYVNKKWINKIRPITISHGANTQRTDRSRFLIEFGWTGTDDPTPYFCIPEVIKYFNSIVNNGWDTIMKRNHSLAIAAREIICNALDIKTPAPAEIIGSMATIPMWDSVNYNPSPNPLYMDALQTFLWENYKIEVPIMPWENYPKRVLRISAQIYNSLPQYEKLAKILKDIRNKNI